MMSSCDQCQCLFNDRKERYEIRSMTGWRLYAITCSHTCAIRFASRNKIQNYNIKEVKS